MPKWDYGGNGIYFVTLLVQNRECVFGHIQNKQMILNLWGEIAHNEWTESMKIRGELTLDAFVVMPNHLHAIVIIEGRGGRRPDGLIDAPDGGLADEADGGLSDTTEDGLPYADDEGSHDVGDDGSPDGAGGGSHDAEEGGGSHDVGDGGGSDVKTHGRASLRDNPPPDEPINPPPPLARKPKSLSSFIAGYKSSVTSQINNGIDNDPAMNLFPDLGKFNLRNRLWHPNYYDHIIRDLADYKRIKHYICNNPANWKEDGFFPDDD